MTLARLSASLLLCFLAGLSAASCGTSERSGKLASGCTLNSDCDDALVCTFGRCHQQCRTSKDCPEDARCVAADDVSVCQLEEDRECSTRTCAPPLVCAADDQCRNECASNDDCTSGQVCASSRVCAEPEEVDDKGDLIGTGDAGSGSGGSAGTGGAGGAPGAGGAAGLDAGSDSGTEDSGMATGGTSGSGGTSSTGGADSGPPACDPTERPSDTLGIFVSPSGDDANTGVRQAPLATVGAAVSAALAAGRRTIYLAPGAYQETLTLEGLGEGLTIEGGFAVNGQTWTRDCSPSARDETLIIAPNDAPAGGATLTFAGALGDTVLRNLSVETKLAGAHGGAPGENGETLIGIFVAETATGELSLENVRVYAAAAGNGADGAPPPVGGSEGCDGRICGEGTDGLPGRMGATPDRGLFGVAGFMPGRGGEATPGTDGDVGLRVAGTETFCMSCSGNHCIFQGTDTSGTCGCGGKGGAPGGPGGGGGASVAVYVSRAAATVHISGSRLESSAGGDGGEGAAPSPAQSGTEGAPGESVPVCYSNCSMGESSCETSDNTPLPAGPPGGTGGDGGEASDAGDGAGGPSYALVVLGNPAHVMTSNVEMVSALGGHAPGGAAAPSGGRHDAPPCGNGALDPGEQCDDGNRIDDDACSNACTVGCSGADEVFDPSTGSCYFQVTSWQPFESSRKLCQNRGPGWDLATFGTARAVAFALDRLGITADSYYAGGMKNGGGQFESINGRPLPNPIPFAAGEPNGGSTELCLELYHHGGFNDIRCTSRTQAICERVPPNYQLETCGDGDLDPLEECDDGNDGDETDGCLTGCVMSVN